MSGDKSPLRGALPVAVLWVGFALCLHNAWVPFGQRFGATVSDDAYYVFGVARHLARGDPPSIDGVHATNGFHPLWTALLVPVFAPFLGGRDFETPISIALTLGAIFHLVGGALLWRITRRLELGYGARLVSLAYFAGNPFQIANAVGGLESALATAALLAAYLAFLRSRESIDGATDGARPPWLFGLACGSAVLARTDLALVVFAFVAAWLFSSDARSTPRATRRVLAAGLACCAVLAPWIAFSLATTRTAVQSSGLGLALLHGRMPEIWGTSVGPALRLEQTAACAAESYGLLQRALLLGPFGLPGLVALAGVGALATRGAPDLEGAFRRRLGGLTPLFAGLALLFAAHVCGRLSFREWYTSPFVPAAALLVGVNVDWLGRRMGGAWGPQIAALLAMAALAWPILRAYGDWRRHGIWKPPDGAPAPAAPEPKDRFAHTDCGALAYYATTGVTNLDGLANQGAYEALRDRALLDYIRRQGLRAFVLAPGWNSEAFLGRGARESIVSTDDLEMRVAASPEEKDARIVPLTTPYRLASVPGRELLGDGWLWPRETDPGVRSLGTSSELVFFLPREQRVRVVEITLRAAVVDTRGSQPVTAFLDGAKATSGALGTGWSRISVPLAAATAGRHRIRLEFGAPEAVRSESPDWYRSPIGNPVLAVEASTVSFTR